MSILLPSPSSLTPRIPGNHPKPLLRLRPPRSLPTSDEDLLRSLSADVPPTHLPAVRSYENDLARLTLVGTVGFDQAITAAAADGGEAAREHLEDGTQTMVVETLFPGSLDEHSTISTRLFLPARDVNERAKKFRSRLSTELLFRNVSRNILALTFRQVVFQELWNIEISLFSSGTDREMEDLTETRESPVCFRISSSEEKLLASVAEVVCSLAFSSIEKNYPQVAQGFISDRVFSWFPKSEVTSSSDFSICLTKISKGEILEEAKKRAKYFNLEKWKPTARERGLKNKWWPPPTYSGLYKIGGPGFSTWINEYIPAYKIQIDGNKFKDAKFQGWLKSSENRWEALLTHFQMVELANILDMFYEDPYTLPHKQLTCSWIGKLQPITRSKSSKWKLFLLPLVWGCLMVCLGILVRIFAHRLGIVSKVSEWHKPSLLSDSSSCQIRSLENIELEPLCISVVGKIKDSLGYDGDIVFDPSIGAWAGELPTYLKTQSDIGANLDFLSASGETTASTSVSNRIDNADLAASSQPGENLGTQSNSAQDIASYQVVFTNDGQVIGFQPTNRVAVNYWAVNPFAKLLYFEKKLSPGLLEPNLRISQPDKIILIELLLSVNSDPKSWFALARQFKV